MCLPVCAPCSFSRGQPCIRPGHEIIFCVQELSSLPQPETDAVELKRIPGGYFATKIFSGAAKPDAVKEQEAALRGSLQQDGVEIASDEYLLARYNDPSTMAVQRRNEVLIPISNFSLW